MAAELTMEELVAIGREMLELAEHRPTRSMVSRRKMVSLGQYPAVFGLAQHSMRTASTVLDLYERDLRLEAMPLLRTAFELSITAQWLAQSTEAVFGFHSEEVRWRNALRGSMEVASPNLSAEASSVSHLRDEPIETHAGHPAKNFSQLCDEFGPLGKDLYVYYRLMSALTHPSAMLADFYVQPDETKEAGAVLRREPEQIDHISWLIFADAAILWSAGAIEHMLLGKGITVELAELGRRFGNAQMIPLSPEAIRRDFETGRARRLSERKGPRKREPRRPAADPQ